MEPNPELEDEYSSISTTEISTLELYRGAYLSTMEK
jgi:hypothetical protein